MATLLDFIHRLKVRITLYSIINSTTGKNCSVAFLEWLHFRISSTDSNSGATSYSMINSTKGKYNNNIFILIRTITTVMTRKQQLLLLLSSFAIECHTLGFDPRTQILEPPSNTCTIPQNTGNFNFESRLHSSFFRSSSLGTIFQLYAGIVNKI